MTDIPMKFFSENVDSWGASEWFGRLADAIREQDKAAIAKDEISFETYRMIAASSAMTLVRDHEATVRSALSAALSRPIDPKAEVDPVGWSCAARKQSLPEPADCDWPVCGCDPYADKVVAALEECGALSASPSIVAPVVVKPLEWRDSSDAVSTMQFTINSIGEEYHVFSENLMFFAYCNSREISRAASLNDAKAAAQSDYESRILSALTPAEKAGVGDGDAETLLARVASIICDETCGLTSQCKSREAAKALLDQGYLRLSDPAPEVIRSFLDKLAAMPKFDLGFSWQARDWKGAETLTVYNRSAALCKFVLDNIEALYAALSTTKPAQGDGELRTLLGLALETLDVYADPTGYADNYGDPYPADADADEGKLARITASKIRSSLAKSPCGDRRDEIIGNLLDRWEMTPNDLKGEMREHGCGKQLDALAAQGDDAQEASR